jgi:hypothetical protein
VTPVKRVGRTNSILIAMIVTVVVIAMVGGISQEKGKAEARNRPPDPGFLPGPTLAAMIGSSLNSLMFNHYYVVDEQGKTVDVVADGSSCALYVSILLRSVDLCDDTYVHIDRLVEGMERSGWKELPKETRDTSLMVVIWGNQYGNRHIGFAFAGSDMAVSHSSFEGAPRRHSRTLRDGRTIDRRFSHPKLTNLEKELQLHGVI